MKFSIEVNERERTVEVAKANGKFACSIDGAPLNADAIEIGAGVYSILIDGESFEVRVEPAADRLRIFAGGREYSAKVSDPRSWQGKRGGAAESKGRQQVMAPMPGKVVRILAKAGEPIEAGQGLLVVEAMKMQNEVRSPKSGRVEKVLVAEGQSVNAGDVLAVVG
jgi:biotin carboxyl carrier protein